MNGELEITAISIHAYPYVAEKYALTSCGSSMGDKYGPMVVAREPMPLESLKGKTIAIPGELTTAFGPLRRVGVRCARARVRSPAQVSVVGEPSSKATRPSLRRIRTARVRRRVAEGSRSCAAQTELRSHRSSRFR